MTCPNAKDWDLLAVGALEGDQAAGLLDHVDTCSECRVRYEEAGRAHRRRVQMYEAFDRDHDDLRDQLMAALPEATPVSCEANGSARGLYRLGDYLMNPKTNVTRRAATFLAPAACILIVVLLFVWSGGESAFAGAIDYLKRAETIVCQVTKTLNMQLEVDPEADASGVVPEKLARVDESGNVQEIRIERLYISADKGVRRDEYENDTAVSTWYLPPDGSGLILNHRHGTYETFDPDDHAGMPDELVDEVAAKTPDIHFMALPDDPSRLIDGLRDLTAGADRELGYEVIDGRDVLGFEIAGEKVGFGPPWTDYAKENRAEVWVDADTGMPVRLVFHFVKHVAAMSGYPFKGNVTLTTTYDHFELDSPLPAGWFEPVIPEGFAEIATESQLDVEAPDEAGLIKALRKFNELAGRYPTSLTGANVGYEVAMLAGKIRAEQLVAERTGRTDMELHSMDELSDIGGLAFYMLLEMNGQAPEYFGDVVKPGDAESVLIRWRLDERHVRVIYGDLRAETVAQPE